MQKRNILPLSRLRITSVAIRGSHSFLHTKHDRHRNTTGYLSYTMIRGKTKFKCDDCGHTFKAFDIELAATVYSQPMPCPNCGSRHTMPVSFFGCTDRKTYMKIWEMMDKK